MKYRLVRSAFQRGILTLTCLVGTLSFSTLGHAISITQNTNALLDPITGGTFDHFDTTQLDLTFDSTTVVFGSEEYSEFVGSSFIDGYGFYLNGVNIAQVGGQPVNINHPAMMALSGTEFDGILAPGGNPVLLFCT